MGVLRLDAVNGTISTGIDGTTTEVGIASDLWIPSNDNILIEEKSQTMTFGGSRIEGWTVTSDGGDSRIVMGNYKTPVKISGSLIKPDLETVCKVLLFQLGGQASFDYFDVDAITQSELEVMRYQDPAMWKVTLK